MIGVLNFILVESIRTIDKISKKGVDTMNRALSIITMERWRWLLIPLLILGMLIPVLSAYSSEESFLKKGKEGRIAFLSGGVGQEEREALKQMGREYPLKLMFSNRKGEDLSDVTVKVLDQNDKTILTTVSNGPWLFINLPPGVYHLEASFRGNMKKIAEVNIEKEGQKVIFVQWRG